MYSIWALVDSMGSNFHDASWAPIHKNDNTDAGMRPSARNTHIESRVGGYANFPRPKLPQPLRLARTPLIAPANPDAMSFKSEASNFTYH